MIEFQRNDFLPRQKNLSKLIDKVKKTTPPGEWIFRALKKGPTTRKRKVPILSSFDKAWNRRTAPPLPSGDRRLYEAWMLRDFKREAYHYLSHLPERDDFLEWLALGRHYLMPVRLLDFTYSFYIAVYFAVSRLTKDDEGNDKDGWVLAFNLKWSKEHVEKTLTPSLRTKCNVEDAKAAFQDKRLFKGFAFDYPEDYVVAVNPLRRNPRLAAQQGLFLCPGNIEHTFEENLKKTIQHEPHVKKLMLIPLHPSIRTETMRELRRMNISSASLFRDLPGWAESQGDIVHMDIKDGRFKEELKLELKQPR
jgi:hypothetical protein